jgi:metal-responsive CopG/Arc/MetJ family transcriptional regulator
MARVPASEKTRNELRAMLTGKGPVDRSCLVRQAVRMIVEEALESEATQALGSVNSERGAQRRG